jgi:hypothetical protein
MPLPKNINPSTLNGLKGKLVDDKDQYNYETHTKIKDGLNALQDSLRPGAPMNASALTVDPGMGTNGQITAISGTFKRGKFTLTTGTTGFTANPTVTLNFPQGTFEEAPFATVVRNGGNGALGFTYSETVNSLTITLNGTPTASTTYNFQFAVRD